MDKKIGAYTTAFVFYAIAISLAFLYGCNGQGSSLVKTFQEVASSDIHPYRIKMVYSWHGADFSSEARKRIYGYIMTIQTHEDSNFSRLTPDWRRSIEPKWLASIESYTEDKWKESYDGCGGSFVDVKSGLIFFGAVVEGEGCLKAFQNKGFDYVKTYEDMQMKIIDHEFICHILPVFGISMKDDSCWLG